MIHYQNGWSVPEAFGAVLTIVTRLPPPHTQGEVSLQGAIVGMAQTYVGSNNINLLLPNGQFGTRLQGGKDAGSARYIHTALHPITPLVFPKADDAILQWRDDDGTRVEPKHYLPILPFVLCNGPCGIGTGFSVQIPCYNPLDIVDRLRVLLNNDGDATAAGPTADLDPWYRGFKGRIVKVGDGKWMSVGVWTRVSPIKVRITELPVGVWTEDYKVFLEDLIDKTPDIRGFDAEYTDEIAAFGITFANAAALDRRMGPAEGGGPHHDHLQKLDVDLHLHSFKGLSTTNMYLFDGAGRIKKYASALDIIVDFHCVRLAAYARRREVTLQILAQDLAFVSARAKFVQDVIDGRLRLMNVARADVDQQLEADGYPAKDDSFDYLLAMPASSFTAERRTQLLKQKGDLEHEIARLEALTPRDLWRTDLDSFVAAYTASRAH